jgi:hypothetical protein
MLIDGNKMIEALGLPEWDDRVLDILEEFGEERPVLDDDKDIFIIWMKPEGYGIVLMFDDMERNNQQREASTGDVYLGQVVFNENTTMKLPFGIEMGDDKDTIEKKIGEKAYAQNNFSDNRFHWLLDDGEKKYFFNCDFTLEKNSLEEISLILFDEEKEYEMTLL